jgi:hypothetical protein
LKVQDCALAILGSMISTHDRDQGYPFNVLNLNSDAHYSLSQYIALVHSWKWQKQGSICSLAAETAKNQLLVYKKKRGAGPEGGPIGSAPATHRHTPLSPFKLHPHRKTILASHGPYLHHGAPRHCQSGLGWLGLLG